MAESTVQHRDARDRVIHALGLGLSYPMRDLPLTYDAMVAFELVAQITIGGSQAGVRYQLCDEDGNPIEVNGQTFVVEAQPGDDAILQTPPVTEDVTYTILAVRNDESRALSLETYLNEAVSIKAGVDTGLTVKFEPLNEQQIKDLQIDQIDDHQIIIAYDNKVRIMIVDSQEGVSYQLYEETDEYCENLQKDVSLSNAYKGTREDLTFYSKVPFTEDITLLIKAFRTTDEDNCAYLEARLTVNVRPNVAVAVAVDVDPDPRIYDYGAPATFSLTGAQASVSYRLYQRGITPKEYVSEETEGRLEISTDGETLVFVEEGHTEIANKAIAVFIETPVKTAEGDIPPDYTLVGAFEGDGEVLSITTDPLFEDTLFVVQATKTFIEQDTGVPRQENLQLDQTVVLLVRPNTGVGVEASPVDAGAIGMVTLAGTQHGVFYQMVDPPDTLVGFPGYHYEERGVQRTRLEVDFVIEAQEPVDADGALLLPTGPLTKTTTFTILAVKTLTGISAPLKSTAKIDVVTEDGG